MPTAETLRLRWRSTQRMTAGLLFAWFLVTFGVAWFARDLSGPFFGWPFSFWVAAQGAPLVYLLLVGIHTWHVGRLDRAQESAEHE